MVDRVISAAAATSAPGPSCVEKFTDVCAGGLWGAVGMLVALLILHTALFVVTSRRAQGRRPVVFLDIIVTGDDNRYSLSRLQVYMWTILVAVCFVATSFATGMFAGIPGNLALLMGVNLGAAVASTAITTSKASATQIDKTINIVPPLPTPATTIPSPGQRPCFLRDIFYESGIAPSLDLPRTQMFLWTVITLVSYIVLFITKFPNVDGSKAATLLDVPVGMLALMGVSQAAYLGAKAATPK